MAMDYAQLIISSPTAPRDTRARPSRKPSASFALRFPAIPSDVWNEDDNGLRVANFEVATCGADVALTELCR